MIQQEIPRPCGSRFPLGFGGGIECVAFVGSVANSSASELGGAEIDFRSMFSHLPIFAYTMIDDLNLPSAQCLWFSRGVQQENDETLEGIIFRGLKRQFKL